MDTRRQQQPLLQRLPGCPPLPFLQHLIIKKPCCFTLYKVPEAKQEEVIGQILKMDLKPIAEKIIEDTVRKAEEGFEAVLAEK